MQTNMKEFNQEMSEVLGNLSPEKQLAKETLAHNNEAFGNIPLDVREKINAKFKELKARNPKWSINRTLRKAGEFYKVKFSFE